MGNFSKDMEAIQKSKMEMSDMKNSVSEMKNYFNSPMRMDTGEERIGKLKDRSREIM